MPENEHVLDRLYKNGVGVVMPLTYLDPKKHFYVSVIGIFEKDFDKKKHTSTTRYFKSGFLTWLKKQDLTIKSFIKRMAKRIKKNKKYKSLGLWAYTETEDEIFITSQIGDEIF